MSLNVDKLREKLINSEKKGGGGNDPRFLNYFNLDFGQQMTVRFLPDGGDSEELWAAYAMHGPNLDNQDVGSISCAKTSSGERCPACSHSYNFHKEGLKEDAKKWRAKEYFVAQCVVVESSIEVTQSPDGNLVKLMYLPFGVKEAIKDAIINQTISDPTACDFVIKKTKNSGGFANYDKSYFKTKESDMPDTFLASIEAGTSYLYVLGSEVPEPATAEQVGEWLDKAIPMVEKQKTNVKVGVAATPVSSTTSTVASSPSEEKETTLQTSEVVTAKPSAKELLDKLKRKQA